MTTSVAFNAEQLKKVLTVDAKIDANYLKIAGGTGHYNYSYAGIFNNSSLNIILSATTEFARRGVGIATAADFTKNMDPALFERTCGSRYVAIERRGATVSVILSISSADSDVRTAVQADLSAHGSYGPVSCSVTASLQSEVHSASQTGRLSIQVLATGGGGFGDLKSLIESLSTDPKSFTLITKAFGDYLKTFTADNAAPIGFHVASMENFGWDASHGDTWTAAQERAIRTIVSEYRDVVVMIAASEAIRDGVDVRNKMLSTDNVNTIVAQIPLLQQYIDELTVVYLSCRKYGNANCAIPDRPNIVALPAVPPPPRARFLVKADDTFLDPLTSQQILSDARYSLLQRTQRLRPQTSSAASYLVVEGFEIITIWVPDVTSLAANRQRTEILYYKESSDDELGHMIFQYMSQTHAGSKTFVLRITDALDRKFDISFLQADWNISGNNSAIHQTTLFP